MRSGDIHACSSDALCSMRLFDPHRCSFGVGISLGTPPWGEGGGGGELSSEMISSPLPMPGKWGGHEAEFGGKKYSAKPYNEMLFSSSGNRQEGNHPPGCQARQFPTGIGRHAEDCRLRDEPPRWRCRHRHEGQLLLHGTSPLFLPRSPSSQFASFDNLHFQKICKWNR